MTFSAGTRSAENDAAVREMVGRSAFRSRRRPPGETTDQAWFARYRLLLNYTYLHLTRLGLTPVERFLLCHLIACTAERLFGTAATEVRFPAPGELTGQRA